MTKNEIKKRATVTKHKVRKGDRVMIITGKDKGQLGFIEKVLTKKEKVIVLQENTENPDQPLPLNAAVKHFKARTQTEKSARIKIPVPIHVSNVMVFDPKSGDPIRVGRRKDGDKTVRYSKKSGTAIKDAKIEKDKE